MPPPTFDSLSMEDQKRLSKAFSDVESARDYWNEYVIPILEDASRAGMTTESYVKPPLTRRVGKELESHMIKVSKAAVVLQELLDDDTALRLGLLPATALQLGDAVNPVREIRQRVVVLQRFLGGLASGIGDVRWGHYVNDDGKKVYDESSKKKTPERRLDYFLACTAHSVSKLQGSHLKATPAALLDIVFGILNLTTKTSPDGDLIRGVDAMRGAVQRQLIPAPIKGSKVKTKRLDRNR